MAARARVVSVTIEHVDHDHGHWCNTCLLSTGLRVWVAVTAPGGRMHLQQRLHCYECAGHNVTVEPDARHC